MKIHKFESGCRVALLLGIYFYDIYVIYFYDIYDIFFIDIRDIYFNDIPDIYSHHIYSKDDLNLTYSLCLLEFKTVKKV